MSRAHMLYDDKALQSIPVKVTTWDDPNGWQPEQIFKLSSSKSGLIVEGTILGKSRHLIIDKGNTKHHYIVFHIDIKRGCIRRFDKNGEEIQPDFGAKQKVNTGYLMSSYKNVSKDGKDVLQLKDIKDRLKTAQLDKLTAEKENSFKFPNAVSLWALENDFSGMEFSERMDVRLNTTGEKCYLESMTCLDLETKNLTTYTTDKPLGGSWTDKVLGVKDKESDVCNKKEQADEGDGVAEEEWDD
ncbi:arpin-like [Rhopilema esculentum]|uniref:arpin-like n=1 Tax=Rhopilema esculentum TaxID=499914 RepID=UPI0031D4F814